MILKSKFHKDPEYKKRTITYNSDIKNISDILISISPDFEKVAMCTPQEQYILARQGDSNTGFEYFQ